MSEIITVQTSDTVKVNVSNSSNDVISFERKLDKRQTISDLKVSHGNLFLLFSAYFSINWLFQAKLEVLTGGNPGTMKLELYSGSKLVCKIENNDVMLGSLPIEDGMRLHVIDNILFDQNVEKFELTTQQYDNREDSVRSFLKRNKLGKYNAEEMVELEKKREEAAKRDSERAAKITISSRCKVSTANQPTRIGTVMYNGELEGKKGIFIGVKFDEPLGVNDGS